MRMNLKVPFADKEQAKKLGARWDATRKVWYVVSNADLAPFSKWSPTAHDASVVSDSQSKEVSAGKQQATGKVFVGSAYVEHVRICNCLPWDVCEKCEPTILRNNP